MRLEMVDLRAEAIAEARRLAGTRAMTVDGDAGVLMHAEAEGPWIAVARRRRIRRARGGRRRERRARRVSSRRSDARPLAGRAGAARSSADRGDRAGGRAAESW